MGERFQIAMCARVRKTDSVFTARCRRSVDDDERSPPEGGPLDRGDSRASRVANRPALIGNCDRKGRQV